MSARIFDDAAPRAGRLVPALAGTIVVVLALPVFVVAGWPLAGWLLARRCGSRARPSRWLLTRLPLGTGNLAAAGMRGIGTSFRAFAVGIPLVVATVADERVGIAAALVYALAYTVELAVSLLAYFGAEARA